jgi:hypothetical protein
MRENMKEVNRKEVCKETCDTSCFTLNRCYTVCVVLQFVLVTNYKGDEQLKEHEKGLGMKAA